MRGFSVLLLCVTIWARKDNNDTALVTHTSGLKPPSARSAFGCLYDFDDDVQINALHSATRQKIIAQFSQKGASQDGLVLLAGGNSSLFYYSDTEVLFR
jgi:hypothetical protein